MSFLIGSIIDMFKGLWNKEEKKTEMEGYIILHDSITNKTLLLVKNSENSWKTNWFNDIEYTYKTPDLPLFKIFKNFKL